MVPYQVTISAGSIVYVQHRTKVQHYKSGNSELPIQIFTKPEKPHNLLTKNTKNTNWKSLRIQILFNVNPDPACWLSSHPGPNPYGFFYFFFY